MLMPTNRVKAWLRDSFFTGVQFLPGIRNYVLQMRFKPMPIYRNGVLVTLPGADTVGKMLIQPDVEDACGQRRKLDDVLGPWFSVVGWQNDPQAALSDADRAFWRELGARFVQVHRARSGDRPGARLRTSNDTECVEDVDNHLADWFAAHPGSILVLRPDRYIAAQSGSTQMAEVTQRFRAFVRPDLAEQRRAA
jgi:3-(3-hydroxy-phenyl)propionate hydroxylase